METNDVILRHLLDLCRKSEKTGSWQYSGFLSPAEQDDWLRSREAAGFRFLLDAVISAFVNLSRGQTDKLFASEKVFVNGRMTTDRSARLKEGDVFSVRGFGKAVYDGVDYETKKKRYMVSLRKLI